MAVVISFLSLRLGGCWTLLSPSSVHSFWTECLSLATLVEGLHFAGLRISSLLFVDDVVLTFLSVKKEN